MVRFQFYVVLGRHCLVITLIFSKGENVELGGIQMFCKSWSDFSCFCLFSFFSVRCSYQNETKDFTVSREGLSCYMTLGILFFTYRMNAC